MTPALKGLTCGDGTTALPAARLGADVLGVDIASNLVAAGNRGAEEEGLTNMPSRRETPPTCVTCLTTPSTWS